MQSAIRLLAGTVIGRTIRDSQGLYSDGWAGPRLRYMLPPGSGPLTIEGTLPNWQHLSGQTLSITANDWFLGRFDVAPGDFQLIVALPSELDRRLLHLRVKASRSFKPGTFTLRGDRRRLAYLLRSIRLAQCSQPSRELFLPAGAAI